MQWAPKQYSLYNIAYRVMPHDCDLISCNAVRSAMRPLRSYFPTRCIRGGPTSPIVRIYSPASVYWESRIAPLLVHCTRYFAPGWEGVETPIRGAEPCAQKSGLGPEGVRDTMRHNGGGPGSDWRQSSDSGLGHWSRTLRSDNGVERVTLRFNSSQAQDPCKLPFIRFLLFSCKARQVTAFPPC